MLPVDVGVDDMRLVVHEYIICLVIESSRAIYMADFSIQVCWDARDRYWECLDKQGAPSVDKEKELCKELRKVFTTACSNTWV